MAKKADPGKVNASIAIQALRLAKGDLQAVYSQYIKVHFRQTGKLAPGCDNRDLQAWIADYQSKQETDEIEKGGGANDLPSVQEIAA